MALPEGSPKVPRHEMLALFAEMSINRVQLRAQLESINVATQTLTSLLLPAELHLRSLTFPLSSTRGNKAKATHTIGQNATIEVNNGCSVKLAGERGNGSPLSTI